MESLCVRVPKSAGERARRELKDLGVININLKIKSDNGTLLIPVLRKIEGYGDIGTGDFEAVQKEETPVEILGFAPAYEQLGDIAIIERHENDPKRIAEALLQHKKIKTVLQAQTPVEGEYRTRELLFLAGENRTETLYRENGCRYALDIALVYFTPRLSTERMRIAEQIKNGDTVVDMFAGVGPFSILIAKRCPSSCVIAIDKNPDAIKYLNINKKLNKVKNLEIIEGDAREVVKGFSGADHIIMNLPHSGLEFIDAAIGAIKKGGAIHFYALSHEDDLFEGILNKIEGIAHRLDVKVFPLDKRIVRPYAPYQYNVCIDFKVV